MHVSDVATIAFETDVTNALLHHQPPGCLIHEVMFGLEAMEITHSTAETSAIGVEISSAVTTAMMI
jgi:hypothetical protein